jgi:soluble lytic murein transglycosylase
MFSIVIFNLFLFTPPTFAADKLADFTCEQLIEKAADKTFPLAALAGLRAHRNCPNFKYEWRGITDLESKLYADALFEVDPTSVKPLSENSIDELKIKLSKEKNNIDKFNLYKQLRLKYKAAGHRTNGEKTIQQLYQWTQKKWKSHKKNSLDKSQYIEASYIQAKMFWNSNKTKQAKKILNNMNKEMKSENLAESYFLLGKIAEDENKDSDVVKNYDLALAQLKKHGELANRSVTSTQLGWLKSWSLYKSEKWTEAEIALQELSNSTDDLTEATRADFFRSRVLTKLDKPDEAKLILKKIIEKDTYSYYALASYHLLGENLPAISKIKRPNIFTFDQKLSFLDDTSKSVFEALIKYNEPDIAEKAVQLFAKNDMQNVNLSLYLADKMDRFVPLFSSFARLSDEEKTDVMKEHPSLVFPRPYESEVKKMSSQTELPTSLIYSIMKQESGFNITARSPANAFGLMQLIPALAKTLSKKYDIEYTAPEDLYVPKTNIALGSFELRDQIKKQNGQLTFVAAAYNAGPNALSRWLKTKKPTEDVFDFVESIPYDETRLYVKIVARNKLFYDRFEKPDESLPFPVEFVIETSDTVSKQAIN